MDLLAIAIAPGIAICLFILHRDAFNREPKLTLIISFVLGMATILPAIFIENAFFPYTSATLSGMFVRAFFVVALTEEAVKFAALRLYAYNRRSFDEPLDGIVYSVMVSMGFATLENILYVQQYGMTVGIQRMFLAVPAHGTFAVLMGYYIGKAKFAIPARRTYLQFAGLAWATAFHGAYDYFLFIGELPEVRQNTSNLLLLGGAVVSLIVAAWLSFKHLKTHRILSKETHSRSSGGTLLTDQSDLRLELMQPSQIPLVQNLAHRIWPGAYGHIISAEQITYMLQRFYSAESLQEQLRQGHFFFLLNRHTEPVGFLSVSAMSPGLYRLHKLYLLDTEQGKGTGRSVLNSLFDYLRQSGGNKIELNVNRFNVAKGFYEKMGFAILREENIDIGQGFFMNDYVMWRTI